MSCKCLSACFIGQLIMHLSIKHFWCLLTVTVASTRPPQNSRIQIHIFIILTISLDVCSNTYMCMHNDILTCLHICTHVHIIIEYILKIECVPLNYETSTYPKATNFCMRFIYANYVSQALVA